MKLDSRYAVRSGVYLLIFTVVCVALVQLLQVNTKQQVQKNIAQIRLDKINELVQDYDNDILAALSTKTLLLSDVTQTIKIYPAKKDGIVFASLIEHTYPQGYSGDIVLLSAITPDRKLIGSRVITHKETPGLGDRIDVNKSNWILQFNNKSLQNNWEVNQFNGEFDALTGATISSRAVIDALTDLLSYWQNQ